MTCGWRHMFTGIVEEKGLVQATGNRLVVGCRSVAPNSPIGASVAVNGVCLTVVAATPESLGFDLSPETLIRTSLDQLEVGDLVNLECPATLTSSLGGHLVQGHVDGVATVADVRAEAGADAGVSMRFDLPVDLMRYVVVKGSITIDGVSLTVADLEASCITVAVIPHTLAATTLGSAVPGDRVNIEVDVIAKYVEKLMEGRT
jgi:riboflavin synthase